MTVKMHNSFHHIAAGFSYSAGSVLLWHLVLSSFIALFPFSYNTGSAVFYSAVSVLL